MNLSPDPTRHMDLTGHLHTLQSSLTPGASGYNAVHVRFRNPVAKKAAKFMWIAFLAFFTVSSCVIGYALAFWR